MTGSTQARTGVITRWRDGETYGLIIEDGQDATWFVSRTGRVINASNGMRVTFTGRARPVPGKRYPEAFRVRPEGHATDEQIQAALLAAATGPYLTPAEKARLRALLADPGDPR